MQPRPQSTHLKKDKEPKPELERRMRPHGKQGYSMRMESAGSMMSRYWNDLLPVNIKWILSPENTQALA